MSPFLLACTLTTEAPEKESTPVDTGRADSDSPPVETHETDTGAIDSDTGAADTAETGDTAPAVVCDRTQPWTFVDAGIAQTCGIHADGCAECWGIGEEDDGPAWDTGAYHYQGEDKPPAETFVQLDMLKDRTAWDWAPHACGILVDGTVECWGNDEHGMSTAAPGVYVDVAVTPITTWGVSADGRIIVWGDGAVDPLWGSVTNVQAGYGVLALTSAGDLSYWNEFGTDHVVPLDELFTAFDFGTYAGCGITPAGDVHCWLLYDPTSWETTGLTLEAPAGPFVDVCVTGESSACVLTEDGTVTCWAEPDDYADVEDVPEGHVYTQIACGLRHACAVTVDGEIVCWGHDYYGETLVPT